MAEQKDPKAHAAPPVYRLAGFDVSFPHQPYGVQLAFMSQVIKAIDHQENALLEAPTGCGKTLSLLCSALAWQTAQKHKKAAADQQRKAAAEPNKPANCLAPLKPDPEAAAAGEPTSDVDEPAEPAEEVVVPKIYYATRTHSQIAQVVRELKRTAYKPRMAVLGARPHYCINKRALNSSRGVEGECEELLKNNNGCRFHKNARTLSHGMVQVHDIEDLHRIGNRHKACPYFTAKHLAESAELVFCPYSYLLDPNIRRASKVEAADAILIFDEAHNIEDQAREAGSTELDIATMAAARDSLRTAACMSSEGDAYMPLAEALATVVDWLARVAQDGSAFKSTGFERFEQIMTGQQMVSSLCEAGLEPQAVEHLWSCYTAARQAEEKAGFNTEGDAANEAVPEQVKSPGAGGAALGCVSQLLTTLRLLYGTYSEALPPPLDQLLPPAAAAAGGSGAAPGGSGGSRPPVQAQELGRSSCVAHYRMAVQKWVPREGGQKFRARGRQAQAASASTGEWGVALCLWCLNPAVVFRSLSEAARSVLLTSGTLSPLDSFGGELGLRFHLTLEAKHVVDMNRQVFARVVSHGPEGRLLNATFREADKAEYQDSLGQLLLAVAGAVPDGVLLFLPSYSLMDKLRERWAATGVWRQLERLKHIVPEPRHAGADFDAAIQEYYRAVRDGRGGLFMAVCRGKASEGIDFADGNARCVLVVGIPFPNVKDSKVGLKKEYNNASAASTGWGAGQQQQQLYGSGGGWQRPGSAGGGGAGGGSGDAVRLLSGDQWYSQQAFRALNQAIGRCIRHKLDYGAILLVDERFRQPRNQSSLSKWVRGAIGTAASTPALLSELQGFFAGLAAAPPGGAEAAAPQQQQQQALAKPGLELQPPHSSKPGFEAADAAAEAAAGPKLKLAYEADAGAAAPGYTNGRSSAAAAAGGVASAESRWRQPQAHMQQQQDQGKAAQRLSGPMYAFLRPRQQLQQQQVKQEQQQQQQQVKQEQQQQQQEPPPPQQQQQQQALKQEAPVLPAVKPEQQQQAAGPLMVKAEQQQPGPGYGLASTPAAAAASECCAPFPGTAGGAGVAVTGCQLPAAANQPWPPQQQQQLQRPFTAGQPQQQRVAPPQWQAHQQGQQQGRVAPPQWQQQTLQQQQGQQIQQQGPQQHTQQQSPLQPVSCMVAVMGFSRSSQQPGQQQQVGGQGQVQQQQQQQSVLPLVLPQQQQQPEGRVSPAGAAAASSAADAVAATPPTPSAATPPPPAAVGTAAAVGSSSGSLTNQAASCSGPPAVAGTGRPPAGAPAASGPHNAAAGPGGSNAPLPAAAGMPATGPFSCVVKPEPTAAPLASNAALQPPAAAAMPGLGGCDRSLLQLCRELGLGEQQLQQWVAADLAAMRQHLTGRGTPAAGQHGCSLDQLASFGIMGSFELAASTCQQQQQPAMPGPSSLAGFWPLWHSPLPAGLLLVAAAAGQLPGQQAAQLRASGLEGPWLQLLAQRPLQHNLHSMADAYDRALDVVMSQQLAACGQSQQQQRPPAWGLPPPQSSTGSWQQQQQQQQGNQQWPQAQPDMLLQQQPTGHQQQNQRPPQQYQQQQRQFQKQPGQQPGQQPGLQQRQFQQQPGQQQQQFQQQQHLQQPGLQYQQQFQQQQQQPPPSWGGRNNPHNQASRPPAPGNSSDRLAGPPAPPVLQLSQSARQPKRHAARSEKAQLAAQKRARPAPLAAAVPVLPPPAVAQPRATSSSRVYAAADDDEDDDFV